MAYSPKEDIQKDNAINIMLALFLCIMSIVLMFLDKRQPQRLNLFKNTLQTIVYPIQIIASSPTNLYQAATQSIKSRDELQFENNELRKKQLLIESQLQRMVVLDAENSRLRMLLKANARVQLNSIFAELISIDFNPYRHFILLNHGRNNEITIGQPVINQEGIVGQTMEVTPYSSRAILITDPNHLLPIQVNRNGLRGLAVGTGKLDELIIQNISNDADIKKGDLLVSSGLDGRFPAGYAVAEVIDIQFDANRPFAKIIARPTANLDKLREVLIVSTQSPNQQEED